MQIPGKQIALSVREELEVKIKRLAGRQIHPHLAVVIVGNDAPSHMYVRQKKKTGEALGITVSVYALPEGTTQNHLMKLTDSLNNDASVHGIIIQRPVPLLIPNEIFDLLVKPQKDVDGFHPLSLFTPPIAMAVLRILAWVHQQEIQNSKFKVQNHNKKFKNENAQRTTHNPSTLLGASPQLFFSWLREKKIVIIGRGVTSGRPIARTLRNHDIFFTVAHSKTMNVEELCQRSDIIISCVGQGSVLRHHMIHTHTILIGVGLHEEDGKLAPDYNQEDIAAVAGYYTPVPGGVGPVNVACLLENVVLAAEKIAQ